MRNWILDADESYTKVFLSLTIQRLIRALFPSKETKDVSQAMVVTLGMCKFKGICVKCRYSGDWDCASTQQIVDAFDESKTNVLYINGGTSDEGYRGIKHLIEALESRNKYYVVVITYRLYSGSGSDKREWLPKKGNIILRVKTPQNKRPLDVHFIGEEINKIDRPLYLIRYSSDAINVSRRYPSMMPVITSGEEFDDLKFIGLPKIQTLNQHDHWFNTNWQLLEMLNFLSEKLGINVLSLNPEFQWLETLKESIYSQMHSRSMMPYMIVRHMISSLFSGEAANSNNEMEGIYDFLAYLHGEPRKINDSKALLEMLYGIHLSHTNKLNAEFPLIIHPEAARICEDIIVKRTKYVGYNFMSIPKLPMEWRNYLVKKIGMSIKKFFLKVKHDRESYYCSSYHWARVYTQSLLSSKSGVTSRLLVKLKDQYGMANSYQIEPGDYNKLIGEWVK